MIAQEGGIDVIGVGTQICLIRLLQGGGIGGNSAGITRATDHRGDLAVGIAEGKIKQAGDAAFVILGQLLEAFPNLCHQISIRLQGGSSLLDPAENLHILGGVAGNEFLGSIQTEAGHTLVEPEGHDVLDLRPDCFAVQIHIGHIIVKLAFVIPVGAGHFAVTAAGFFAEEVIIQIGAVSRIGFRTIQTLQIFHRHLEPCMLGTGMVQHQVDDDMDVPLLALRHEVVKILHGTVLGIDGIVIGYIILMVRGAGMNGHQPDALDSQVLQIVQFRS